MNRSDAVSNFPKGPLLVSPSTGSTPQPVNQRYELRSQRHLSTLRATDAAASTQEIEDRTAQVVSRAIPSSASSSVQQPAVQRLEHVLAGNRAGDKRANAFDDRSDQTSKRLMINQNTTQVDTRTVDHPDVQAAQQKVDYSESHTPSRAIYQGPLNEKGLPHGLGERRYSNGMVWKGEYKDGMQHGKGELSYPNGNVIIGEWRDGKITGKAQFKGSNPLPIEMESNSDRLFGKVGNAGIRVSVLTGTVYLGDLQAFKPHGKGQALYLNGDRLEATWNENGFVGKGELIRSNGSVVSFEAHERKLYSQSWQSGRNGLLFYNADYWSQGNWENGLIEGESSHRMGNLIVYKGACRAGKRHGYGELYDHALGNTYSGNWENDLRHGKGTQIVADGSYTGNWVRGYINGQVEKKGLDGKIEQFICLNGELVPLPSTTNASSSHANTEGGTHKSTTGVEQTGASSSPINQAQVQQKQTHETLSQVGTYEGEKDGEGRPHGRGTMRYANGGTYTGNWEHGKRVGFGEMTSSEKNWYRGNWADDKRDGIGTYTTSKNGNTYSGGWKSDKPHGHGEYMYIEPIGKTLATMVAKWEAGRPVGEVEVRFVGGSIFHGVVDFTSFFLHGAGVLTCANGDRMKGTWVNGWLDGKVDIVRANGALETVNFEHGAQVAPQSNNEPRAGNKT